MKEVFNLAEQGLGLKAITHRINEKGFKSKRDKLFSTNAIKQILDNPMYIGKIRFNQVEDWNEKRRRDKNENFILADGVHDQLLVKNNGIKCRISAKKGL